MQSHSFNSIISRRNTYINHHLGIPKQKHSFFGRRVPDCGTVIFHREIKLKIGFGVVISKEVYRS